MSYAYYAHPVIGELRPYRSELETGFERFEWSGGVEGLAKVEGNQLHLLAVYSETPGTGEFRRFMIECMAAYSFIRVWSVWSDRLRTILQRHGFVEGKDVDQFGDWHDVWDWKK